MSTSENRVESGEILQEALAEVGQRARDLGACSICWALVAPGLRDQHLDWHASLAREVDRERLPQVYGGPSTLPGRPDGGGPE